MSSLPWFYNIFNPEIFEKERKETMTVYDNHGVTTSNAAPNITEKQHMKREDILMICKNALNPYEGGSDAYIQIKQALEERKEGEWIKDGVITCHCSNCNKQYSNAPIGKWNHCPNCGVQMIEPQESEGEE